MFEKQYFIDPGSDCLRMLDPKTQEISWLRDCWTSKPFAIADQALKVSLEGKANLITPMDQGHLEGDIKPLVDSLIEAMPLERFHQKPIAVLLCPFPLDLEQQEKWRTIMSQSGFSFLRFSEAFTYKGSFFHIHAGASWTIFTLVKNDKIIARQSISLGGASMDKAIEMWIGRKYKAIAHKETIRQLRQKASEAFWKNTNPLLDFEAFEQRKGFTGLTIQATDLWPILKEQEIAIAEHAEAFLHDQAPSASLTVLLSGGLAKCYDLPQIVSDVLKKPVELCPDPSNACFQTLKIQ